MHTIHLPCDGRELRGELKEAYGVLTGDDGMRLEGSAEKLVGDVPMVAGALTAERAEASGALAEAPPKAA